MRLLFALPGFHRYDRGAEVALLAVAGGLALAGEDVTVMGSGPPRGGVPYQFVPVRSVRRERFERFPMIPPLRTETAWEDATFAAALLTAYRPADYDAVITCSFPFTHWALRRPTTGPRPRQIFVTQNGDWPAVSDRSEFRTFRCDGLVCTNPDFAERNRARWNTTLIPNGIHPGTFSPGPGDRTRFGLPAAVPVVLMVSALIESKRVIEGIEAVGQLPGVHLVVAGDGPLREAVRQAAATHLPGRFTNLTLGAADMPQLYNCADAFLHMSLLESFGNVFVEAMASGLPIVGHDTPRLRWIVGEHQPLCATDDRTELVTSLRKALTSGKGHVDPRVEEFHWPNIAMKYRDFITSLVKAAA